MVHKVLWVKIKIVWNPGPGKCSGWRVHMAEINNVVLGSMGFLFMLETMGSPKKPIGTPLFGGDQEKTMGHGS